MRPIHSALEIVALIGQRQPIGVSAIARETGLPKTTAHRVLQTLHAAGWIEPDTNDGASWSLSIRAALAVGSAQRATWQLHGAAFPIMEELRNTTGESVYLAVRDADTLALIERLDGRNPLAHAWPLWQRGPLHATSLGKSMLAHLDPAELEACLNATLPRMTRQTKTDRSAIEAELAVTRARLCHQLSRELAQRERRRRRDPQFARRANSRDLDFRAGRSGRRSAMHRMGSAAGGGGPTHQPGADARLEGGVRRWPTVT